MRSATIEVITELGEVVTVGKFGTDQSGYAEMLSFGRRFPERTWAVEGCNGWSMTARRCWMCRRRCGCSPPAPAASPVGNSDIP